MARVIFTIGKWLLALAFFYSIHLLIVVRCQGMWHAMRELRWLGVIRQNLVYAVSENIVGVVRDFAFLKDEFGCGLMLTAKA